MAKEAASFHVEGLEGLSSSASRFLQAHPREARMVVTAALEAAALQHERQAADPSDVVPEDLMSFGVHRPPGADMIGVSEAAARLEVSRTTVYDWVDKHKLVGWKTTKRGLVIPVEQILGPGRVVPGLEQVLAVIEDPELTWFFLSQDWPFAKNAARPLDKLKSGQVEEVVDAAFGFDTTFT